MGLWEAGRLAPGSSAFYSSLILSCPASAPAPPAPAAAVFLRFCVLSLGSLLIGVGVSLCCALLLKRFQQTAAADSEGSGRDGVRGAAPPSYDAPSYEIALIVCGSYMAYLLAEVCGGGGGCCCGSGCGAVMCAAWLCRRQPPALPGRAPTPNPTHSVAAASPTQLHRHPACSLL